MKIGRELKPGEIEIVWSNGSVEIVKTDGLSYQAGCLVLQIRNDKVILPFSSVKRFRVKGI